MTSRAKAVNRMTGLGLLLCMLLSFAACGTDIRTAEAKTFTCEGMSVTLTKGFRKKSVSGFTVGYNSGQAGVLALREAFTSITDGASMSLEDYAQLVLNNNRQRVSIDDGIKQSDGLTYMEYIATSDNREYSYFVTMFKGSDAFWLVQFFCKSTEYTEYRPYFINWAKTVTFSEA